MVSPQGEEEGLPLPAPAWVGGNLLTVVVFALLQGLAEALAQGQVTLSSGGVQELLDLIGAGPQLQRLGGRAGRDLGWAGGSKVNSSWRSHLPLPMTPAQGNPKGPRQAE